MMNNNTIDASGGGTGKRGLDAVQEKATNNLVVTPNQQRRKTSEGEPMELEDSDSDVEPTQPTNFDKAVEKQVTKPAASSWKKVSKKGEKTKQTSFAAAAVSRVQEMVTETETIVVKAPRTQQKSVVQDYAGIMKMVYQGYVDVLGVGKVCFRAVDEHIAVVYKGNNMGLDDFQLSEMFVASETMWKAKQAPNNTGMDALFDVKQGSKKEWMELVLVLGHSGIAWGDYGSIRSKLLAKHIRLTVKQTPGLHSNSNVAILQGATRLPLGAVSKLVTSALTAAVEIKEDGLEDPPQILVTLSYPPGLYSKESYIKNAANKKVLVVTYDRLDKERIMNLLPEWKNQCRKSIGRFCYFQLVPDMKDPDVPEMKKEAWKGRASMHALMNEVLVHFSLVGFRNSPFGLDKSITLTKIDGSTVVTTARDILMALQLPEKKKNKPRFALIAACQTSEGVEVVFPNSPDSRNLFHNMAVCPAAWFLYHWLIDLQITKDSMLRQIKQLFEPEYVTMATNCVERETDGTLFLTYENGEDTLSAEVEELKDVEWMKSAIEAVQLNQSNGEAAMENGRMYDFDEESDLGSVNTQAFIKKRFGESFSEMADARDAATSAASLATADTSETPPSNSGVVGSKV